MTLVFLYAGCTDKSELVSPAEPVVSLSVSNLPHLSHEEGYYQLWATFLDFNKPSQNLRPLHDEGYISLGTFNVSENGRYLTDTDGHPVRFTLPTGQNPQLIDRIAVTIQAHHHGDSLVHDDEPGQIIMGGWMRGTERNGVADLRTEFDHAIGSDFRSVLGNYTIMSPTSGPADSNSGIWFVQLGASTAPSLRNLPVLHEGWTYEGWVVHQPDGGQPVYYSTGKFLRPDSADFDGAGSGSGSGAGLNFPGQDFITGIPSRPDLTQPNYWFMVTVEPVPDTSPHPFSLRILSNEALTWPRSARTTLPLQNVVVTHVPSARMLIRR